MKLISADPSFRFLVLFLTSLFYTVTVLAQQKTNNLPNVLFIAIDDLNSCLDGMNGETTVHTPNINSLAARGILFTNAHCAAPACNPSRASVMTGLAPSTSGVYFNNQDWRVNKILKDRATIPHHFQQNGYTTHGGGKLYHAASLSEKQFTGLLDPRPWDEYFPSKNRQMPPEVKPENFPVNGNPKYYGGHMDWAALDIDPDEMADAKVVSWAEKHLSINHDKPLFLAVGIYRPHIPWWTPKEYFDKHPLDEVKLPEVIENDLEDVPEAGRKMRKQGWHQWTVENNKWEESVQAYNASVSFADDMVGRLLAALKNGPMAETTIVVLWTDHGYHLGQKEHWEKFALWEQTTRVPLIIAAPGNFQTGKLCDQPVSLLDIYPTLVELTGTKATEKLDGVSLVPLLKDPKKKTNRSVVITQGFQNHAVRSDKWRYTRYADGSEELYNQITDPKNFHNLLALHSSQSDGGASSSKYQGVKKELSVWLPKQNASLDPTDNYLKK
jgi:arylsulfatase A-like enzyme